MAGIFAAHKPGPCAIGDLANAAGHVCQGISPGDRTFYLVCTGNTPATAGQIADSKADDGFSTGYRIVAEDTGETRSVWNPRTRRRETVNVKGYRWRERVGGICAACTLAQTTGTNVVRSTGRRYPARSRCSCQWQDVAVWSNLVHVSCASALGFNVPGRETEARPGSRTVGREHRASDTPVTVAAPVAPVAAEPSRQMHMLTDGDASKTLCGMDLFAGYDGDAGSWRDETTRMAQRVTCLACRNVPARATVEPTAANAVNAALAGQPARMEPAARPTGQPPAGFVQWMSREPDATREREAAIAARNAAAQARRATPVAPVIPAAPVDVPEDVEDRAAFMRFARLELD
jgi:hypothetical protein